MAFPEYFILHDHLFFFKKKTETRCSILHSKIPSNIAVAVRTSQFTMCISEWDVPRK